MANRFWVGGTGSWDATAGSKWALTSGGAGGQLAPTSADTVFFDANSGANTVTIGAGTSICSTLTMTGFTGTLAFGSNSINLAGAGTGVFTGATTYSVTGTPLINLTYSGGAGTTLLPGNVTEANAISFNVSAGPYSLTVSGAVKNLTFSGTYTGSLIISTRTLYGNLTFKSGMTIGAGSNVTTFAATSGTQTITSAGLNLDFPVTLGNAIATTAATGNGTTATLTFATQTLIPFRVGSTINVVNVVPAGYNGTYTVTACTTTTVSYASATTGAQTTAGGVGTTNTVQLVDALTLGSTRTLSHQSGTFDLTDKTVTTGLFTQGAVAVRTMAFGTTGSVNVTGNNASIWVTNGSTPSTLTGAPTVNFTYSGSVGTRTTATGSNSSTTNRYNFNFTAGSDIVNVQNQINNLDFTGFSGTWSNFTLSITGNLILSPTMTVGGGTGVVQFFNWGGTHQVTSSGKNLDFPITIGSGLNTTAASGNGTTATLTFASTVGPPPVGSTIQVSGLIPAGYNTSSAVVTASSSTSVSYANTTTGSQTTAGTVGTTSTVRLEDAMSQTAGALTRGLTLSFGGFDLNNKTCTLNLFSSTNTAHRTLDFTTTQINIIGSQGTVWNTASGVNLVFTGTDPTVNLTYSGGTGFRNIGNGTSGQPGSNAINFNVTAGTDIVTFSSNFFCKNADFTGFSGTLSNTGNTGNTTIFWSGNLTISSGMSITAGTSPWTWIGSTGGTITSAGKNFNFPITFAMSGGATTFQLQDDLSVGTATTRVITLTSGTLDLNNKSLTNFGSFSSSSTSPRAIAFGTTGNYTNTYNLGTSTIFNIAIATNFSITGTPTINVSGNATTGTRRLDYGNTNAPASPEANSLSFYVTAGSDSIQITSTSYTRNLDFTGSFSGSLVNSTRSIYGNYTLNPNMTVLAGGNTTSFLATSGTQLITTAGRLLDIPVVVNTVGAGVQLVDDLTVGVTRTFTLTAGTLDLNNKILSTGLFQTNSSLTREIIFGNNSVNGIIKATGYSTAGNTTLVFRADGVTGLTLTGYPQVILDATLGDPTGIRSITGGLSSTEARRFFINVINGTDIVSIGGTRDYRTIDFTGFSGTLQLAGTNNASISGGLIFSSAMTVGTLAFGFSFSSAYGASFTASQSGLNLTVSSVTGLLGVGCTVSDASNNNIGRILSQTSGTTGGAGVYILDTSATIAPQAMTSFWKIDTQNKSIGASISFTTAGSSWKLQSPLSITGQITLTSGIFNANSQSVTAGNFSAANSGTKTLNISNSTFTVTGGSSTTGFIVISGGTTYNLTGCNIVFTTSGVTSFYTSGGTPTTVTMAGTGQLIIGASGTTQNIETLTNTVQPCTVSLLSNILRLFVTNFNLSGTAGNLVTLNSSVAGTQANIRKTSGTVNAQYMYIQDSLADGGAVWNAYDSTNAGNNTGWNFLTTNSGNFFMMF